MDAGFLSSGDLLSIIELLHRALLTYFNHLLYCVNLAECFHLELNRLLNSSRGVVFQCFCREKEGEKQLLGGRT